MAIDERTGLRDLEVQNMFVFFQSAEQYTHLVHFSASNGEEQLIPLIVAQGRELTEEFFSRVAKSELWHNQGAAHEMEAVYDLSVPKFDAARLIL